MTGDPGGDGTTLHPLWLPDEAFAPLGRRRVRLDAPTGPDPVLATEIGRAHV